MIRPQYGCLAWWTLQTAPRVLLPKHRPSWFCGHVGWYLSLLWTSLASRPMCYRRSSAAVFVCAYLSVFSPTSFPSSLYDLQAQNVYFHFLLTYIYFKWRLIVYKTFASKRFPQSLLLILSIRTIRLLAMDTLFLVAGKLECQTLSSVLFFASVISAECSIRHMEDLDLAPVPLSRRGLTYPLQCKESKRPLGHLGRLGHVGLTLRPTPCWCSQPRPYRIRILQPLLRQV